METKMIQYFDEHWYRVTDKDGNEDFYPSVTTKLGIIAKYGLDKWRGDIGNREADLRMREAQNAGKRVHYAWELYQQGQTIGFAGWQDEIEADFILRDQHEYLNFLKLRDFFLVVQPEILMSESTVYSVSRREAGTIDNVFRIRAGKYAINGSKPVTLEDGLYVADVKNTADIYDEAYMQMSAYANMLIEMGTIKPEELKGVLVLHTRAATRSGIVGFSAKLVTTAELSEYFEAYKHAASLWDYKNKTAQPKRIQFPEKVNIANDLKEVQNVRQ